MNTNVDSHRRVLFLEDNLPVLHWIDSDSIDLIATDPPFNTGKSSIQGKTKEGESVGFKDAWGWDREQSEWLKAIKDSITGYQGLYLAIESAKYNAGLNMGAYLCWMAVRLLEMHRVLKPTGSMYLHCDPKAGHYLKSVMDAIFKPQNFRNEIVWGYNNRLQRGGKTFGRLHDTILYYTKTESRTWNEVFDHDWTPSPTQARRIEKGYEERKGALIIYDEDKFKASGIDESSYAKVYRSNAGQPPIGDLWSIPILNPMAKERNGYPTQKPVALYKRIIEASSNPDDIVLDPFAGSATTCIAAELLGRRWIGIDNNIDAVRLMSQRLQREIFAGSWLHDWVSIRTKIPSRDD